VAHAGDIRPSPEGYTRTASGYLSVAHDPPAWPTVGGPMDFSQALSNNFPPLAPALEYRPTEYRGSYIDYLDPSSVESVWHTVGSGMHLGSGGLSNDHVSKRPCDFNETNPRRLSQDVWVPVVRPPAGQEMSGHSSGGISSQVGSHPPAHVPGRGIYGMNCTGKRGVEVTFSSGDMNREK